MNQKSAGYSLGQVFTFQTKLNITCVINQVDQDSSVIDITDRSLGKDNYILNEFPGFSTHELASL